MLKPELPEGSALESGKRTTWGKKTQFTSEHKTSNNIDLNINIIVAGAIYTSKKSLRVLVRLWLQTVVNKA